MINVRKLLARLNPSTQQYGAAGGGGGGGLTAQDIAGALGMVPAGLGREILCHCWWPDGAALTAAALDGAIARLVHDEQARQRRAIQIARLDLQVAEEAVAWQREPPQEARAIVSRLRVARKAAEAAEWPTDGHVHVQVRAAVLGELSSTSKCRKCHGRGWTLVQEARRPCKTCNQTGSEVISDVQRAASVGIDRKAFERHWRPVYRWLLDRLRAGESEAAYQLARRLGVFDQDEAA